MSYQVQDHNNRDLIKNSDFFLEFDNILTCAICLGFLIDPLECIKCQSNYCRECVVNWNGRCPKKCSGDKYIKVHRNTTQILEKLIINCFLCHKPINYSSYMGHIENKCSKIKVKCVNEGCAEQVEKHEIDEHLHKCEFTILDCEECGSKIKRREMNGKMEFLRKKINQKTTQILKYSREINKYKQEAEKYKEENEILKGKIESLKNKLKSSNANLISQPTKNSKK
jgi:hypothetical protein